MCLVLPDTAMTSALFSGSVTTTPWSLAAARIAQPAGSTISVLRNGDAFSLSWSTVALDDGRPTSSRIVRTGSDGSSIEVCTGSAAPVTNAGIDSCTDVDNIVDVSYRYSQQPVLRSADVVTWSAPPGPWSTAVRVPRVSFAAAGPLTTVNSSATVIVPYPTGTSSGDLLLLVARSARNRSVANPSGWTQLVSTGGQSFGDLLVSWRIADTSTSVTVSTNTNGVGAAAQVLRFVRGRGYSGTPQAAMLSPVSGTGVASSSWTLPGAVTVNATNATVVSVATVIGANALSSSVDQGFVLRSASAAPSQNNGFAVGVADSSSWDTGATVSSPTWTQTGTAGAWVGALVAFA